MPAYEIKGMNIPLKAGEDLSEKQYFIVYVSDDNEVRLTNENTYAPLGVLQNDPENGETASVMISGVTKCVAGDEILSGYQIGMDSGGRGVRADTQHDYRIGVALTGASAANERFTLVLGGATQKSDS